MSGGGSDAAEADSEFAWFDALAVGGARARLGEALWTEDHLIEFLPWKRSSIWALTKTSSFPAAYALPGPGGATRLVWLRRDVLRWVTSSPLVAARTRTESAGDVAPSAQADAAEVAAGNESGQTAGQWTVENQRRTSR